MFSLVADYNTSSSTSEDEESGDDQEKQKEIGDNVPSLKQSQLLPSAILLLRAGVSKTVGEVFSNPFLEAEKLELDKLQKHVKMVDLEEHLVKKNGRKICWNNRKGRCRFGNKCKYAHDSDLVEPNDDGGNSESTNKEHKGVITVKSRRNEFDIQSGSNDKPKIHKRPGLGDSIIPGKRVMKTYNNVKKST